MIRTATLLVEPENRIVSNWRAKGRHLGWKTEEETWGEPRGAGEWVCDWLPLIRIGFGWPVRRKGERARFSVGDIEFEHRRTTVSEMLRALVRQ